MCIWVCLLKDTLMSKLWGENTGMCINCLSRYFSLIFTMLMCMYRCRWYQNRQRWGSCVASQWLPFIFYWYMSSSYRIFAPSTSIAWSSTSQHLHALLYLPSSIVNSKKKWCMCFTTMGGLVSANLTAWYLMIFISLISAYVQWNPIMDTWTSGQPPYNIQATCPLPIAALTAYILYGQPLNSRQRTNAMPRVDVITDNMCNAEENLHSYIAKHIHLQTGHLLTPSLYRHIF